MKTVKLGPVGMVIGLVKSGTEWATSGFEMSSDEEYFRRSAFCSMCDSWNAITGRCAECGCYGSKLRMKTSKCPLARW